MPRSGIAKAVVLCWAIACGGGGDASPGAPTGGTNERVASVLVTPPALTLTEVGQTAQLTARAVTGAGRELTGKTFGWSSSDASKATVDQNGKVTAVASGSAVITATVDGVSGSAAAAVTIVVAAASGVWTGVSAGGHAISFVVAGATVTQVAARLSAALGTSACIAVFNGSSAGVGLQAAGFSDSLSNPGFSLSRRITLAATIQTANKATGTLDGYNGSYSVACGGSVFVGSGTLWSATTFQARPLASVQNSVTLRKMTVGEGHTCALGDAGAALCWGWNQFGQVGDGTTTSANAPTLVRGGLSFTRLSAGAAHTCGITSVGATYCWGSGSEGRLGNGSTANSPVPVPVSGGLSFVQLTSGATHSCGLTADGSAYCWGYNFGGQLGDGSNTSRTAPTPVSTSLRFSAITAGMSDYFTCGLAVGGDAFCWGQFAGVSALAPTLVSGGLKYTQIAAGAQHVCAVSTTKTAYCWGVNFEGQIGDNSQSRRTVPTPVSGGLTFEFVSAGRDHSCGVTTNGDAYCWGSNVAGVLGTGDVSRQSLVPAKVFGGLSFAELGAGASHTCAISTRNVAFCWGSNFTGRLGIAESTDAVAEVPVAVNPKG